MSMETIDLTRYEKFLSQKKATKELLENKIQKLNTEVKEHREYLENLEEALDVMNTVGILAQQEFEEVVEVLVTQALRFVFGDNHSFEIDSEVSHNQPEINMYIVIDGERFSPKDDEFSGGQANVVAFALRVILWAIQYEKTRPTLVFDEPFRCLHGLRNIESVKKMIQYLSETLSLQFIIVTQESELADIADASFLVTMEKGISKVELISSDKV